MYDVKIAPSAREDMVEKAKQIAGLLSQTPMTAMEINTALGAEYTALQIANAAKLISGVSTCKVRRMVRNTRGFQVEKEYTAYYLDGPGGGAVQAKPQPWTQPSDGPTKKPASSKAKYPGMAKAISGVLSSTPMTVQEINAALGADYTPLQIANAAKLIPNGGTCKVQRMVRNTRGFQVEKEYTAYFLK